MTKESETPEVSKPTPSIFGVRVEAWDVPALHAELRRLIQTRAHALVVNVNVHALNLVWREPWLRQFFNASAVVFCDGAGARLGAFLLGHRLPPRITYADWIWQLSQFAAAEGLSMFFLGSRPGLAERAAKRLRDRFPELRVVGTHHGYFDRTNGGSENAAVIRAINTARPNILLVGLGMPLQERWLRDNWPALDVDVALTGGAVFDYASGELRRAPQWMTDHGLEWLGRLWIEPRRLWSRYLVGNPVFLFRVLRERLGFPGYRSG